MCIDIIMALNYDILNTVSSYMQHKDFLQVEALRDVMNIPKEAVPDLLLKQREEANTFVRLPEVVCRPSGDEMDSSVWCILCEVFEAVQRHIAQHPGRKTLIQLKRYIIMCFNYENQPDRIDTAIDQLRFTYFSRQDEKLSPHKEHLLEFVRLTLADYLETRKTKRLPYN